MGLASGCLGIREKRGIPAFFPNPSDLSLPPFPRRLSLRACAARAPAPTGCGARPRVSQVWRRCNRYHQTVPRGGVLLPPRRWFWSLAPAALEALWGSAMQLSVLQRRILRWLYADQLRTPNAPGSVYRALLSPLPPAPGSITRRLRRLERHELVTLIHAPGGRLQGVRLTTAGHQRVWQVGRDGLQDAAGGG